MYLAPYINPELNDLKRELYRYKTLKVNLIKRFEQLNALYRAYFPDEIRMLHDLELKLRSEQAKFAQVRASTGNEIPEQPTICEEKTHKEDKRIIRQLYRLICNLCHEDKLAHRNDLSAATKTKLKEWFKLGKDSYNEKDLSGIRFVYDKIVDLIMAEMEGDNDAGDTVSEKYRNYVEDKSDEELSLEINEQIRHVLIELKGLEMNPMYNVLKCDSNGDKRAAQNIYKQILLLNITHLRASIQNVQAAIISHLYTTQ